MNIPEITPAEFVTRRDRGDAMTLLDVREGWELGVASVPGIVHIPMGEIAGRIGELDASREVINLGNPQERSVLEFAKQIRALAHSRSAFAFSEQTVGDDPRRRRPDISKAQALLAWSPEVSLEAGLRETIAYFRSLPTTSETAESALIGG